MRAHPHIRMAYEQNASGRWAKRRNCGVSMKRRVMTKMVMMWLFGVPASVLLLFMIFGVF